MNLLAQHEDKWTPEPNTGCLVWLGAVRGDERHQSGVIRLTGPKRKIAGVARLLCEETYGPPPTLQHQAAHATSNGCLGSLCVNVEHLRWATPFENHMDKPLQQRIEAPIKMHQALKSLTHEQRSVGHRKERHVAAISGAKKYFTGRPCKRGHVSMRYTNSGCVQCAPARRSEGKVLA